MLRLMMSVLALPLLALPAAAQFGNPGFYAGDTTFEQPGVPSPKSYNNTDALFVRLAAESGMAEVEFGRLAGDKSKSDAIGEFAQQMVEDHGRANEDLKAIADELGIALRDELGAEHRRMRERLDAAGTADFDMAYAEGQVTDHQKAVQIFSWQTAQGQNARLQKFAAAQLPVLIEHLRQAQNLLMQTRVPARP